MFINPYDTTAGRIYNLPQAEQTFKTNILRNMGDLIPIQNDVYQDTSRDPVMGGTEGMVYMIGPDSDLNIRLKHPYIFRLNEGTPYVAVIDGRNFTRSNSRAPIIPPNPPFVTSTYRATTQSDFIFEVGRALVALHLVNSGPNQLLALGELAPRTFGIWLSGRINLNLNLEPLDQWMLTKLAAYYHLCQYYTEEEFNDSLAVGIKRRVDRIFTTDAIIPESIGYIRDIQSFIEAAKEATGNSLRLEQLSPRFIAESVSNTWRGHLHRETVALSLEHAPTWIAIVERCVSESSFYKKLPLGEVVHYNATGRGRLGETFSTGLARRVEL